MNLCCSDSGGPSLGGGSAYSVVGFPLRRGCVHSGDGGDGADGVENGDESKAASFRHASLAPY